MIYSIKALLNDDMKLIHINELRSLRLMLKKEVHFVSGDTKTQYWTILDKVLAEMNSRGIIAL